MQLVSGNRKTLVSCSLEPLLSIQCYTDQFIEINAFLICSNFNKTIFLLKCNSVMSFVVFAPLDKPVHLRLCKNQPVAIVIEETEDRCTRGVQREHLALSAAH